MIPSMRIAVRANCQLYPIPIHTVYTKKAFRPIPGARPNGSFAHTAITNVPIMAANAVEVKTAPAGMSSSLNIAGLMARMYDIVRNVVMPAIISVRMVVLAGSNPKSFLSMFIGCESYQNVHFAAMVGIA